jgi:hypothetical protein
VLYDVDSTKGVKEVAVLWPAFRIILHKPNSWSALGRAAAFAVTSDDSTHLFTNDTLLLNLNVLRSYVDIYTARNTHTQCCSEFEAMGF